MATHLLKYRKNSQIFSRENLKKFCNELFQKKLSERLLGSFFISFCIVWRDNCILRVLRRLSEAAFAKYLYKAPIKMNDNDFEKNLEKKSPFFKNSLLQIFVAF